MNFVFFFQITDEEGNPIPLSIQDARQLLSQGQFVSQLNDGQTIRVHSGVITQEFAGSLGVHVNQNSNVSTVNNATINEVNKTSSISSIQTDAEAIVKALEVSLFITFAFYNCINHLDIIIWKKKLVFFL